MAAADCCPMDRTAQRLEALPGDVLGAAADVPRTLGRVGLRRRVPHFRREHGQLDRVVPVLLDPGALTDRVGHVDQDRTSHVDGLHGSEYAGVDWAALEMSLEFAP